MNNQLDNDYMEIDLLHLIKVLWKKAWIIAISIVLIGVIAFSYSAFYITPLYKSTAMMYVNNSSLSLGGSSLSISTGEISAAKSLLDTYIVILKTRATLEEVIETAELDYTYEELDKMISAGAVNATEVFSITVTGPDPEENKLIVDTILDILPARIAGIVEGSSVKIVDEAVVATTRSSPSYTKYAAIGMILGLVISAGIIILIDLLDTTIKDEDYLKQKYNIPILAAIPDVNESSNNKNYYYQSNEHRNKGGSDK